VELEARRAASAQAATSREEAAETLRGEEAAYADVERNIEGLEADVEAARSEVFAAVNAATALRHAMEHATAARARIAEQLAQLEGEDSDPRSEGERAKRDQMSADESMDRARDATDLLRVDRGIRESELAGATTGPRAKTCARPTL